MQRSSIYFLLYVSVILIITFLQQEFVLLPELQSIDIIGEDAELQLIDSISFDGLLFLSLH